MKKIKHFLVFLVFALCIMGCDTSNPFKNREAIVFDSLRIEFNNQQDKFNFYLEKSKVDGATTDSIIYYSREMLKCIDNMEHIHIEMGKLIKRDNIEHIHIEFKINNNEI